MSQGGGNNDATKLAVVEPKSCVWDKMKTESGKRNEKYNIFEEANSADFLKNSRCWEVQNNIFK